MDEFLKQRRKLFSKKRELLRAKDLNDLFQKLEKVDVPVFVRHGSAWTQILGTKEVPTVATLALLLDPIVSGPDYLALFLEMLRDKGAMHLSLLSLNEVSRLRVNREVSSERKNRTDLEIVGDGLKIVVEAKVKANVASAAEGEEEDQLGRYSKDLKEDRRESQLVLLSPRKSTSKVSHIWITWLDVADVLRKVGDRHFSSVSVYDFTDHIVKFR
ncbi:hypothetical protein FAI40_09280 [Acetobacteraceae bacterium]|nr:hypothetical protein FAI40_09280 [Acetobacteraceae bacterium]